MKRKMLVATVAFLATLTMGISSACGETGAENSSQNITSDLINSDFKTSSSTLSGAAGEASDSGSTAEHVHDWGKWETTTPATCTKEGEKTRTCKNDPTHTDTKAIPVNAENHDWGDWETITPVTCTADGEETRTCKNDPSHTKTRKLDMLSHNYVDGFCTVGGEQAPSEGLEYELNKSKTEYTVYKGTCEDTEVIIPKTYNGLFVTNIGDKAFYNCSGLTSIAIPDSVTSIGSSAFEGCSNLISIVIPDSVTSIGIYTFKNCSNLTSIVIPNGVTYIGNCAFYACGNLTSIAIPDSVTYIGNYAFRDCYRLVEIYNLSSLAIEKDSLDNGYIGYYAKDVYTSLDEKSKLSTDKDGYVLYTDGETICLLGYTGTQTALVLPSNITEIYGGAFEECSNLTSIVIPDSVTSIGEAAFYGCSSLTSVIIPDSVTSIGEAAFYDCNGLTSITIGNGVTSIEDHAFYGCYKLVEVYNLSSLVIKKGSVGGENGLLGVYAKDVYTSLDEKSKLSTDKDGYILYTDGETISLIGYTGNQTELVLPNNITEINADAFYACSNLTSIVIPDSVTKIGFEAFLCCYSLTSVTIGKGVTSIGQYAFVECYRLVEIYILSSLNIEKGSSDYGYIGYYAKDIYTSLDEKSKLSTDKDGYVLYTDGDTICLMGYTGNRTALVLPSNITEIYEGAFYECSKLTSIVIPDSVTSIGDDAFYNCSSLATIEFKGTMEQWKAITTGNYWNMDTRNYVVICTDGKLSKYNEKVVE
jgi:hypothetical protein